MLFIKFSTVVILGDQPGSFLQRDGNTGQGGSLFTQPAFCSGTHQCPSIMILVADIGWPP